MYMRNNTISKIEKAKVSTWYKCSLYEARAGRVQVGQHSFRTGYEDIGRKLGKAVESLVDDERRLERLDGVLHDDRALAVWIGKHLSRHFQLIPSKRRTSFVTGFREGRESSY